MSAGMLERIFGVPRPLIAMCHLRALGLLFCNEHDIPYQLQVGPEAVAAMAAAIGRLRGELRLPFGVDLLWDPKAALAVARATGAAFVREVFTGVYDSDMGLMAPSLGDLAAYRHHIGAAGVAVFANITPEFARPVSGRPVAERARSAAFLGVDALLVSGQMAGVSAELSDLQEARDAAPPVPVLANTGVTADNVGRILKVADGVVVGTSLKVDGHLWNPVDPARARRLVALVAEATSG
jgi:membrane complex biogenesis BtpA family protein